MSIHVALTHKTIYRFDRPVRLGPHVIRLRPAPHTRSRVEAYSLVVEPTDHFINWQQDPFGNHQARLVFPEKTRELSVTVDLVVDMTVINPFDFFVEEDATHFPFSYDPELRQDLLPYLAISPDAGSMVIDWAASVPEAPTKDGWTINDFLVMINQRLQGDIGYQIRMEPGVQTPEQTLDKRVGSCRDSAWLLVQILRTFGLAARFVSGYLVQLTADVAALDGPSGTDVDFTDLHAWAEVFLPGAGWIGLDPTSGLFAGEGHIPLACTPEPSTAAPISGATDPCEVEFEYSNVVTRVREDPRVTKPYSDEQWAAIDTLGHAVDADLVAGDVRLTMGGEPTFVSIDDMESAQWNIDADGPEKRALATDLAHRLTERFAPHGLVHQGQGKWYPGEPLPRWQIGIFWRTDGVPVWQDQSLLADPFTAGTATNADAEAVAHAIAKTFAISTDLVRPAYEDPLYEQWQAARRGPDPTDDDAEPAGEEDDLDSDDDAVSPTGWVLPLHRENAMRWVTSAWSFRRGEMYLLPGDSPVGLRLPLDQIVGVDPESIPIPPDRSTFDKLSALPDYRRQIDGVPTPTVPPEKIPPTALAVETRDGQVHVFLPPITDLESALDLITRIEAAARTTGTQLIIEGYPPPRDVRLPHIIVAPDPGVIEVNVHPAHSWEELESVLTDLYSDAHQSRLGTEKFMLDGLHTGTGGGNHLTLGGPTPADSPVLRRPDLLRSLITYWQHHPSLSYLFSGRFIGPTSQAPRVDEGRPEALSELELAFAALEQPDPPPWLVDRALRHLLVDITGNTHRAEFCIDKLFSPDSERGRLGLVEMRAFEMPPHPRMGLVQTLLVRCLIARFWNEPYTGPLVRWGTELHGRYLLPHYVGTDIADVVADLQDHGYPFDLAWLDPFMEFRFPRIGTVQIGDVSLSLRTAIEPWLVLGEEVSLQGTSRYVDSSVERIQVDVDGLTAGRHVVTCNGEPVPLRPTGRAGHAVAGVRFRAWHPPSALHPTIGVHSPLVFDLVDTWTGRSVGGCTYHVSHPGGRAYDSFPVNANEAEARRASRFWDYGHTPGPVGPQIAAARAPVSRARVADEYPGTLDLRHATV